MSLIKDEYPPKRYYTIGEVAQQFDVSTSMIRYWESEFEQLKPNKNNKGERRYTAKDLDVIAQIYQLVKVKGFTLEGARLEIIRIRRDAEKKKELTQSLQQIRSFLLHLSKSLE
jgi:DNA-binding transcriptional MerR regulator